MLGPRLPCILCWQDQNTATLNLDPRVLIDLDASRNITMPPLALPASRRRETSDIRPSLFVLARERRWFVLASQRLLDLLPADPASRYSGMVTPGGTGRAPVGETAAPFRPAIGEDLPSTSGARAGGRTKWRVNPGFASAAASDGLLQLGAAGTLECADGVTGDHGPAGYEHEDSEGASTLRHRLGPRWP